MLKETKKEFENALVDEILEKGKWKCNIQESWVDKSNVIYSKEVVSLIILGNTFYFYLYTLFLNSLIYPTLRPNESPIWS